MKGNDKTSPNLPVTKRCGDPTYPPKQLTPAEIEAKQPKFSIMMEGETKRHDNSNRSRNRRSGRSRNRGGGRYKKVTRRKNIKVKRRKNGGSREPGCRIF